jgi:hypothetical protein
MHFRFHSVEERLTNVGDLGGLLNVHHEDRRPAPAFLEKITASGLMCESTCCIFWSKLPSTIDLFVRSKLGLTFTRNLISFAPLEWF